MNAISFKISASIPTRRGPLSIRAKTTNAELAATIDAVKAVRARFDAAWDECATAQAHESAMLKKHGTPRPDYNGMGVSNAKPDPEPPEYTAAVRAAEKADERQASAWHRVDRAAAEVLKVRIDNPNDAKLKQRAFAWAHETKRTTDLPFEEDMSAALAAAQRDMARLTVVAAPAPSTADDVELQAMDTELAELLAERDRRNTVRGERLRLAHDRATAQMALSEPLSEAEAMKLFGDHERTAGALAADCDLDETDRRLGELQARALGLRATTLAGLRTKVRIAAWWRDYDEDEKEIDSLLADLALMAGLAMPYRGPEDLIAEYEGLGGSLCPLIDADHKPIGVHVRIKAPPSTRASEIEAELGKPETERAVLRELEHRGRAAAVSIARGEDVIGPEEINARWEATVAARREAAAA